MSIFIFNLTKKSGKRAIFRGSLKTLTAFLALAVLGACTFYSVLDGSSLLTERDLSVFFIPPRLLWVDAVKGLDLPLWNPYSYSGTPLLATLQPGVFYPLNLLLLVLPFDLAFNWTIVAHFPMAGIFTYVLARELGSSKTGATTAGLVFMLTGYLFSVHNVMSTLFTAAWAPLAVVAYLRAVKRRSTGYAVATGVVFTVMFTGGGVEVLFATILLVFIAALFPSVFDLSTDAIPEPSARAGDRIVFAAAACVVFLGLSAVQLLPFLELAGQSIRSWGLSYEEATTWSFDFKDFLHFFIPDPYGYGVDNEKYWSNQSWLKTVYIGAVPFVLAFFFVRDTRRKVAAFAIVALAYLALALGRNNPVYSVLFNYFPFFSKIRYPVKFLFVPFLFVSLAAGLGMDTFRNRVIGRLGTERTTPAVLIALATAGAVVFGLLNFFDPAITSWLVDRGIDYPEYNKAEINLFNAKRVIFFFVASVLAVFAGLRSRRFAQAAPHAVLVLLAVDLFFAHQGYYASTGAGVYHRPGEVLSLIREEGRDKGLYRVFVTPRTMREGVEVPADGPFDARLLRSMRLDKERVTGYNIEHRVFDVGGFGVMRRADYTNVHTMMLSGERIDSTNLLSAMNVRYVVSLPEIDSPEFRLVRAVGAAEDADETVEGEKILKVYENLNYLPRFFTVTDYRVVEDGKDYLDTLTSKDFPFETTVLLEEEPELLAGDGERSGEVRGEVKVMDYRMNSVSLSVRCPGPCVLVASESWYPGWKAFVDGEEREVLRGNYIYRAVELEGGIHEVEFRYAPLSFRAGAVISLISALGIGAFAVVRLRGGRRRDIFRKRTFLR